MRSPSPAARRLTVTFVAALAIAASAPALVVTASAEPSAQSPSVESSPDLEIQLSDLDPTGYTVGWGDLYRNASYDNTPLTFLVDGEERDFGHGLFAHAPSTIYLNDIRDYGFEQFEAWVGIGDTARVNGKRALVVFRVVGDGEVLWESGEMSESSEAEHVSVDVSGVSVLELVAEAVDRSSAPNNHAIWADATLSKEEATPWLSASDKTFAIPDQVTKENILEGVFARTLSGEPGTTDEPITGVRGTLRNGSEGNDLTEAITYDTDYVAGQTGTFSVTYRVADAQGLTRSRTVSMTVLGNERARLNADLSYLTTPFASFLYTGRDYLDEQGKRAFDLSVSTLLSFGDEVDSHPLISRWGEQVYQVSVDLYGAGIRMSTEDASYLTSMILDNEPRCFHVKDWGAVVTSRDGVAGTVTFYVAARYGERDASGRVYYHTRLLQTETNATRFLSALEEGMTDAQRLRAVLYPYADWIAYRGGQTMDEALADGQSVCGGNARGSIYLCQRMGIKAYWVRTDSHAWSNVKLNHDDSGKANGSYYRIDLLARPGCFLSVDALHEGFHGHHKEIHFKRAKGYPNMTSEGYPFAWTAWPSVTLEVEGSITVLAPEDAGTFDPLSLVRTASSIYQGDLSGSVSIEDGGLEERRTDEGYAPGFYELTFSVADNHGNIGTATGYVQVVDGEVEPAGTENVTSPGGATFEGVSLWNGREEVPYAHGIRQNDDKSTTFSVEGRGFTYLDVWVGINGTVRANTQWGMNGKIQPEVWATVRTSDGSTEEVNLYTGPIMGWYAVQQHVLVAIPEDAISVTLRNVSKGAGNNHAGWGNPRFLTSEVLDELPTPPTISGVEDGGVYLGSVTPKVSGAQTVSLYRKGLPVVVDPETGAPVEAAASLLAAETSAEWGDSVDTYVPGDEISEVGIYTLVASNRYGQRSTVSFTVSASSEEGANPEGGEESSPEEGPGESVPEDTPDSDESEKPGDVNPNPDEETDGEDNLPNEGVLPDSTTEDEAEESDEGAGNEPPATEVGEEAGEDGTESSDGMTSDDTHATDGLSENARPESSTTLPAADDASVTATAMAAVMAGGVLLILAGAQMARRSRG